MKFAPLLAAVLIVGALAGCAGTSTAAGDEPSSGITTTRPADADNPPPALSGYLDSSYTLQGR